MEERRRHKRLDLDVAVQLERLDVDGVTTLKYIHVETNDLSKSGLGFVTGQELELGSYYDTKLQIWTKETIDAVIEIVRREQLPDGSYHYGGMFIGMTETDSLKIEIYQIFNEQQ
ncbi:MAG: PilZ domain-containing protein [Lachnospiraceae bacterium]